MHDERYRTVFAFPRMVEDLLRGFAAREWAAALDVSALRKLPAERHRVVDARHVGVEDLPEGNLMTAVVRLEQTRTPWDLVEVARMLRRWLRRPEDDGLRPVRHRLIPRVEPAHPP